MGVCKEGVGMPQRMRTVIDKYVTEIQKIYGAHLKKSFVIWLLCQR